MPNQINENLKATLIKNINHIKANTRKLEDTIEQRNLSLGSMSLKEFGKWHAMQIRIAADEIMKQLAAEK